MTLPIEQLDAADLIVQELMGCADLTTLIGDRLYPDEFPQGATGRCCRYETLSRDDADLLDADPLESVTRLQIDAAAPTRREANRVAMILAAKMRSLRGRLIGPPGQQVQIWDLYRDTNYTRKDPGPPGEDGLRYRRVQDWVIHHDEPVHELADPDDEEEG